MKMKLIETVLSQRSESKGKTFEIFKSRGDFTGTSLFFVQAAGAQRGEWFFTQKDAHKWLRGGYEKDPFLGSVHKLIRVATKQENNAEINSL